MYIPPLHKEDRTEILQDAIRAAGLATLVTLTSDGLIASHVPMLLDSDPAPYGTLLGHVARPNKQARGAIAGTEALAIFQGPDAYITPSWYETKRETGRVVPTWNYTMVQAKGRAKMMDDVWLARQIEELTRALEERREKPWAVGDAPADFIAMQRRAIVGVEIEILDIRGKWKTSQNRNAADRAGVVAGLEAMGDDDSHAMAEIVRETSRD